MCNLNSDTSDIASIGDTFYGEAVISICYATIWNNKDNQP